MNKQYSREVFYSRPKNNMPGELRDRLTERYYDHPLRHKKYGRCPGRIIIADIKIYLDDNLAGQFCITEDEWKAQNEEAKRFAEMRENELKQLKENDCQKDFIAYMHLEENYRRFRKEAHCDDGLPFGHYTL